MLPDRKYSAGIGAWRRNRDARGPPGDLIKFIRRQWAMIFEHSGLRSVVGLAHDLLQPGFLRLVTTTAAPTHNPPTHPGRPTSMAISPRPLRHRYICRDQ